MVIRLFVPPGEGKHKIIPKRPDPIGANATLQYSLISSTVLAAAYSTFAPSYVRQVTPSQSIPRTALFIRSSAKLGLWAGIIGATVNWYYYSSFASVVASQDKVKARRYKLYKWTKNYTVEDGCLAGAALGLAASVPTLFMRRLAIPRWTRCLGMMNIGGCAGVLGAHGYFQYTGERQKAYRRFDRRMKRRSLEFWAIFWDKEGMAQLDPLMQQYVRHNGIWYTNLLPDSVYEQPDNYGRRVAKRKKLKSDADVPAAIENQEEPPSYYTETVDYAQDLQRIDVETTLAEMEKLETEKAALLKDAEYMLFMNAHKQHEYCHLEVMDDDERQQRLREIHVLEIAYNNLRSAAHTIDTKLIKWRMSLQHKTILEASSAVEDRVVNWLPKSETVDYYSHKPTMSLQVMEGFQTQLAAEIKRFERMIANHSYPREKREKWKKDLEDGRVLLKAADYIMSELEQIRTAMEGRENASASAKAARLLDESKAANNVREHEVDATPDEKQCENTEVGKDKATKPPSRSLKPDKS